MHDNGLTFIYFHMRRAVLDKMKAVQYGQTASFQKIVGLGAPLGATQSDAQGMSRRSELVLGGGK